MSGRTKRIIYAIVTAFALLLAVAGTVLLAYFSAVRAEEGIAYIFGILICFCVGMMIVPLHTLLHELGHVCVGAACGMRVICFSFGGYRLDWQNKFTASYRFNRNANGAAALLPKDEKGARRKLVMALYAGAGFDFLYAAVMFALYFAVTQHPAMLFFTLFAPFCLYEGLMSLYPISLPAGPTDGEFAIGLLKKRPEAEVSLRVMTAQGMLFTKNYEELPRAMLMEAPVIREDCTAFLALLQLKWRYLYCVGEDFLPPLERMQSLFEYVGEEYRAEVAADLVFYKISKGERDAAQAYRAELTGRSTAVLRALAMLEPTAETAACAEEAAKSERMRGVANFETRLLDGLKQ